MNLLIMQSHPPLTSSLQLSTAFSNTINLCSLPNVKDQVPRTCETTGKIIVRCKKEKDTWT
jgi:hypothetical protein